MEPSNLTRKNHFFDNGENQRERESFQSTFFKNLDFRKRSKALSFFRSDFRGSKFYNCFFFDNNFSRCDFISTIIENSEFVKCNFKSSAFINSQFKKTVLSSNYDNSADIVRCVFDNCKILQQDFERAVWRDVKFTNTVFNLCSIEMSTIENVTFDNCQINGMNLANIIAIDLKFINTSLDGVTVDPDYLGTYLFDYSSMSKLKFMYRGKELSLDGNSADQLLQLSEYLYNNSRYAESFNILSIIQMLNNQNIKLCDYWKVMLNLSLEMDNILDVAENTKRLFSFLMHYVSLGEIKITDLIDLIKIIHKKYLSTNNRQVNDLLYFGENNIVKYIEESEYSEIQLIDINNKDIIVSVGFSFETSNKDVAIKTFKNIINFIFPNKKYIYNIISIKNGSIIIDVAMYLITALVITKTVRQISGHLFRIILEYKTFKQALCKISNQSKLETCTDIANKKLFSIDSANNDQSIDDHLKKLKEIKIFVNN